MSAIQLKSRREALGLSIKALGEVWGVRTQSITSWEYGQNHPRDWSWINQSITGMEEYQDELTEQLIDSAKATYEETGEAALVTYASRGAFYHWNPSARDKEWPGGGRGIPVELHRAASARALRALRRHYGEECVSLDEVPRID